MSTPIVLIHGYSDKGESFLAWRDKLRAQLPDREVFVVSYRTLTNEVSIKDIAEAFDRTLKNTVGLGEDEEFDAMVHSTGMLVIRSWLTTYPERRSRLKRLIGIAPATFGSPLATAGRSTLGAIFKGNKEWGPDFLEAGDLVLDGLELASRFTWDLAHLDLLPDNDPATPQFYGDDASTPYVFIFCGNKAYSGLRTLVNKPGTDGTVRWAGCALNTRKITLDLTHDVNEEPDTVNVDRFGFSTQKNVDVAMFFVEGLNHGSIIQEPPDDLVQKVVAALGVASKADYDNWTAAAKEWSRPARAKVDEWQQFIIRAIDERGDGIQDFNVQVGLVNDDGGFDELEDFDVDVHAYQADKSFRSFHVNLTEMRKAQKDPYALCIRVIASTGTKLVSYLGHGNKVWPVNEDGGNGAGMGYVTYDLSPILHHKEGTLFYPFTTTLVEIMLNREPMPLTGISDVCWMLKENP